MALAPLVVQGLYLVMRTLYTCLVEKQIVLEEQLEHEWPEEYSEPED